MPRPPWPPNYANVPIAALLDEHIPHGAFRFYAKLRALAWGEPTLSIPLAELMRLTDLSQTRVYEYARLLRDRNGLLFHCAQSVFECSFPEMREFPEKREKPNALSSALSSDAKTSSEQRPKSKAGVSRIPEKRENGAAGAGAGTNAIKAEYVRLLGYKPETWAEGEAKAAQAIGEKYTVQQFAAAYTHYKSQKFWADKRLSLRYLVGQLPEFFEGKKREVNHGTNGPKRDNPPGGGADEPLSEAQLIARRLSGGGTVGGDHGGPRPGG